MPVECLAHLFGVYMAVATSTVGPVFTGTIFQVGVNEVGITHRPAFSGYGCVVGLVPSCACRIFGCVAH